MPIGVPRVIAHTHTGEALWVDIYNRLYQEKLIFLGYEIDPDIANQFTCLMIHYSMAKSTKDTYLFINSPGGGVLSGMAIYDVMQFARSDIQTICMGFAASMASFILVGGAITKRMAFPHARVMIHQPAANFCEAQTGEFILEAEELLKIRESVTMVYVQRTGKPLWVVSEDLERDVFMSATEAQAHGIVDRVAVFKKKK